jgi:hypothetical protein
VEKHLPRNRRITIREVSNVVGVPFGSVQWILRDRQPEKLEFQGLVFLFNNASPFSALFGCEFQAATVAGAID